MVPLQKSQTKIAMIVMAAGFLLSSPRPALAGQDSAATQVDPKIESVSDTLAFIRWVAPNPGGTILHYAVVRYGTNPSRLDWTAKSPTRINPDRSDMIFRVRVDDLRPGTTYYYRVFSQQVNGAPDPAASTVNVFTTRASNENPSK